MGLVHTPHLQWLGGHFPSSGTGTGCQWCVAERGHFCVDFLILLPALFSSLLLVLFI